MSKQEFYNDALRLFVEDGLSCPQIAQAIPVSEKSLQRWAQEGAWRSKRVEYVKSQRSTLVNLQQILEGTIHELSQRHPEDVDASTVDKIIKLVGAIKKLHREMDLPTAMVICFDKFLPWLQKNMPELAELMLDNGIMDKFAEYAWELHRG